MSVKGMYVKVGDKLRYLGGDSLNRPGRLEKGEEYVVIGIDEDGDYLIRSTNTGDWFVYRDGYNSDCFEPVRQQLDVDSVEVGDKVRYLGGDPAQDGSLTIGGIYEIYRIAETGSGIIDAQIKTDHDYPWHIGEEERNLDCFELVGGEKEEEDTAPGDAIDMIVKLSQEVAKLKRELSELSDAIQTQKHEDNARIKMLTDDIAMLDERTQDVSNSEPEPVRKVVYEYERYYD